MNMKKCPVFICYRQVDGTKIAQWLFKNLNGQRLPDIGHVEIEKEVPMLDVYFDQTAPAVSDWKAIQQPRLRTSQAMIIVCTPGSFQRLEKNDWVHREIDWWLKNRQVAPILIDATGEGERWVPKVIKDRWPDAQRITVVQDDLLRLKGQELHSFEEQVRSRILNGIVLSKQRVVFEDLERQKKMSRRLKIALVVALVLAGLAGWQWQHAKKQSRIASEQTQIAREQTQIALEQKTVALTSRLATQATSTSAEYPQRSLLLAAEAINIDRQTSGLPVLAAEQSLHEVLMRVGGRHLITHEGSVSAIAISADNNLLVTAGQDGACCLWDFGHKSVTQNPIVLKGLKNYVKDLAISPDSRWLVTVGNYEETARLWELTGQNPAAKSIELQGHTARISQIAISSDSHWLVTAAGGDQWIPGNDCTVRLWDLTTEDQSVDSVVLRGHQKRVYSVAVSPDNRWVITGSFDKTARLWDLTTEDPSANSVVLRGHGGVIYSVAMSTGSRWAATASSDKTARLWDLSAKDPATDSIVLTGHNGLVWGIAITPDDRWVITLSSDNTARLWDLTAEDPTSDSIVLGGHQDRISCAEISLNGHWLMTGSDDKTAVLWDLVAEDPSAKPIVLRGHESPILLAAFSPDSQCLVTGSWEGTARIWNLAANDPSTSVIKLVRHHHKGVSQVTFSPNNRFLVTAGRENVAHLWDLGNEDKNTITSIPLEVDEQGIRQVVISSNNRWCATLGESGVIHLWNLVDKHRATSPVTLKGHEHGVQNMAISPDSRWLVTTGKNRDRIARLWDLTADDPTKNSGVLKGHEDGWGRRDSPWYRRDNRCAITSVAFSSNARWLATGGTDRTTRLWDLTRSDPVASAIVLPSQGYPPIRTHDSEKGRIEVAFSPDNRWLATGGEDGLVHLWDLTVNDPSLNPILLRGLERGVRTITISPDSRWLVATTGGFPNNVVCLWDLTAEDLSGNLYKLEGHKGGVSSLAISPDSNWLVFNGTEERIAHLWSLTASDPTVNPIVLTAHEDRRDPAYIKFLRRSPVGGVSSFAFSPDNRWLATASTDKTVQMWDLTNKDPSANSIMLRAHTGAVSCVAFSGDNHWLVTASEDNTARLWNMRVDELIDLAGSVAGRNLTAQEWKQYLPDEPYHKTFPNLPIHPSFIEAGRDLARAGDVNGASAIFRRAKELEPTLDLDPEAEARKLAAEALTTEE